MPKPVLVIDCVMCCSLYLLDLAEKREAQGLPVEYGICAAHRQQVDTERWEPWLPKKTTSR